jgi:hypothetical protein
MMNEWALRATETANGGTSAEWCVASVGATQACPGVRRGLTVEGRECGVARDRSQRPI